MIRTTPLYAVAAALLAALSTPAPLLAQGGPPPANVRVAPAEVRPVRELRLVTGQAEAAKRSTVAAEESGRVVVSPPPPGTVLKKGQEITRLDDTLLKIDLEAAQAVLEQAEAALEEREAQRDSLQRDLARLRELLASNVAKQKEVDDAADEASSAEARVAVARALIAQQKSVIARLEERLAKTRVLAPFDSTIVSKEAEMGEWTDPGDTVVEVIATDPLRIRLNVPEQMIARLPLDAKITLNFTALDETREVNIFAVVPDANVQARSFSVLIYLDNADGEVKPGMSVSTQLPTGRTQDSMTVPRDAVVTTPSGPVVYAARGGVAVPVNVRVLFPIEDRFVVEGTLRDGEPVVILGNERLNPGQPLNVTTSPVSEATTE